MAYVDRPDPSPRFGFKTYADDTPRFESFDEPAFGDDVLAYEDPVADRDDEPAEPSEGSARLRLAAWLGAALAVAAAAFVVTLLLRSSSRERPARLAAPSVAAAPAPERQVQVAPAPPAVSSQPLAAHASHAVAKPRRARLKSAATGLPAPLNCARPASPGQRVVCRNPGLLAADRRMARAYAAAKAAGAPPRILRQDQVKWLNAREAAARRSRPAVERLYRSRIQDLESQPYRACAGAASGGRGLASWLLSVPKKIVSPRRRPQCG